MLYRRHHMIAREKEGEAVGRGCTDVLVCRVLGLQMVCCASQGKTSGSNLILKLHNPEPYPELKLGEHFLLVGWDGAHVDIRPLKNETEERCMGGGGGRNRKEVGNSVYMYWWGER